MLPTNAWVLSEWRLKHAFHEITTIRAMHINAIKCRKSQYRHWRGICHWNIHSSEVFECRQSRDVRLKVFEWCKPWNGGVARATSHAIVARFEIEHSTFQSRFSRQYDDKRPRNINKNCSKFSIALLAPISWRAALTTSPRFGKKISYAYMHLAPAYRDQRHSQHVLGFLKNFQWRFSRQNLD